MLDNGRYYAGLAIYRALAPTYLDPFFLGSFFRLVPANSLSCFLLIDLAICLEGPLSDDMLFFPRLAPRAAPAAICCFFDLAGIL